MKHEPQRISTQSNIWSVGVTNVESHQTKFWQFQNEMTHQLVLWPSSRVIGSAGRGKASFFPRSHCLGRTVSWPVALRVPLLVAASCCSTGCRFCGLVSVVCKGHWMTDRRVTDHLGSTPKRAKKTQMNWLESSPELWVVSQTLSALSKSYWQETRHNNHNGINLFWLQVLLNYTHGKKFQLFFCFCFVNNWIEIG